MEKLLAFLELSMDIPQPYGWFHLLWFALSVAAAVVLCVLHKKGIITNVRRVVLITAVIVTVLELYKQFVFSFSWDGGLKFDYPWWVFPWQFCSMPMYVGLVAGLTKGWVHKACCAFLASYSLFAGFCVMFYPTTVFVDIIGINVQTMFCHGSMITVGIFLMVTGYVKPQHRTVLQALPVFAVGVAVAVLLNELTYRLGVLEHDSFNAFFVSPYVAPHLPVYSLVQPLLPFGLELIVYIGGFTLASWLIVLAAMGVDALAHGKKKAVA